MSRRAEPLDGPGYLGFDAAGVVDEVGEGVTGCRGGRRRVRPAAAAPRRSTRCSTPGRASRRPSTGRWRPRRASPGRPRSAACACWASRPATPCSSTAARAGSGAVAVQMALARGAKVIASASEANQDYLREIGATPVLYGDGRGRPGAGGCRRPGRRASSTSPARPRSRSWSAWCPSPSQVVTIANFDAGAGRGAGDRRRRRQPADGGAGRGRRPAGAEQAGHQGPDVPVRARAPRRTASARAATSAGSSSSSPTALRGGPACRDPRRRLLAGEGRILRSRVFICWS